MGRVTLPNADEWEPPDSGDPIELEVEVTEPEVLGYLLDASGVEAWTLLDRRPIPFGFQPNGTV